MFLRILVVCQLLISILVDAGYEGRAISCVCSTTHCLEHQMPRCNTTGMCFSQYLDRGDGSDPVMRGCISSKTPLLCENRRPAIAAGSWPVLLCCNSNLCNRDVVPTLPSKADEDLEVGHQEVRDENDVEGLFNSARHRPPDASSSSGSKGEGWSPDSNSDEVSFAKKPRRSSHPRILSPVYISVLVVGICSLVAIGIVAMIVLRRNNRFYADQYGAMERHDYLKPRRSYPRDDPELRMPLPPAAHGIYDNKLAGST